jgi:hypothetical protein
VLRRIFEKKGFGSHSFDQAIAEEKTARDVLRRLFVEGTPPRASTSRFERPFARQRRLARLIDPAALAIIEELSKDLPPELERYIQTEDNLESRKRQAAEASRIGRPAKDVPASLGDVRARMDLILAQASRPATPQPGPVPPPDPPPPPPSPTAEHPNNPKGGGGGGGAAQPFSQAYERYVSNTFAPPGARPPPGPSSRTGPVPTPRSYTVAIRSARAARGIAVGGNVKGEISAKPMRAAWIANAKDDRFGRLFVQFEAASGQAPLVGASRVLFADSFYAAHGALAGAGGRQAEFREGEILVLMSMDPDLDPPGTIEARRRTLLRTLSTGGGSEIARALDELAALGTTPVGSSPVDIVTHPAIFGRELAWSAARVDFWFNQLGTLSQEAAMMNGGKLIPEEFRSVVGRRRAFTWQFFEQDSAVRLGQPEGRARRLIVASTRADWPAGHFRSHFGISMFGRSSGPNADADGLEPLPQLERDVQPLLDWLAENHHDFMRLNDFSEAFSLLRWLGSMRTPVAVLDMDGQGEAIATPDRVVRDKGPEVGPKQ